MWMYGKLKVVLYLTLRRYGTQNLDYARYPLFIQLTNEWAYRGLTFLIIRVSMLLLWLDRKYFRLAVWFVQIKPNSIVGQFFL